jgi:hypothetical protein
MKAFRVSYIDGNGHQHFGVYIIAPDIHKAVDLAPGKVKTIQDDGICIAVHQEIEINPLQAVRRIGWFRGGKDEL